MSLRRIGILLGKELFQGPKNFIFVWAVIAPVGISLLVSLVFGTLFSEKPRLGIFDEGSSGLVALSLETTSIATSQYDSAAGLRQAVGDGAVDVGIVLPEDFDSAVTGGEDVEITAYVWGESQAKSRVILSATIVDLTNSLTGQEAPVVIETISLGDEETIPWSDRVLPLIVLMAVFVGGLFLPATSVITEKEKKTLQALAVTPTSIADIFISKGLLGVILSLFMGIVILIMNQAFGTQAGLLVLTLALGAIMAAAIGLICGALIKDITSLFAIWKSGAIILFAPAIIYLFPQIPQWVAHIFPTYYLLQPIIEISQGGASWGGVATNILILTGIDALLIALVALTLKKKGQFAA
jgi:ABC-2 type transport system permease protein